MGRAGGRSRGGISSQQATQQRSQIGEQVGRSRGDRRINAKSIMGVMMLAAGKGSKVTLETDGVDEAEAMEALLALIADYFGEGE